MTSIFKIEWCRFQYSGPGSLKLNFFKVGQSTQSRKLVYNRSIGRQEHFGEGFTSLASILSAHLKFEVKGRAPLNAQNAQKGHQKANKHIFATCIAFS